MNARIVLVWLRMLTDLQSAQKPPLLISTVYCSGDGRHTPVLFLSRYLHAHSLTMSCKKLLSRELGFGGGQMKGPGFGPPCSPPLAAIPPVLVLGLVHISADGQISVQEGLT
jgi:hypothetical protein